MKKNKQVDLAIVIALPLIAMALSIMLKINFLISTVLLFLPPALWLSFRKKSAVIKAAIFSLLFATPLVIIIDYILVVSEGWYISNTVFNGRLFGVVAWEQFIWGWLCIYLAIIFYEYFLDRPAKKSIMQIFGKKNVDLINPRMDKIIWILFIALVIFFFILLADKTLLNIPYSYLAVGVILILIPFLLFIIKFPNFWLRFLKATVYFAYLGIVVEITGLKGNHWIFPGTQYVSQLPFFGFNIPLEEYFFYFFCFAGAILAYYEFFDDDRK